MRTAPNTFGALAVRARAQSISLHFVRTLLVDHCFPCTCTAIKARFSLFTVRTCTVYRTIVVLLSVRMRTVRNTNSWLNFRACARNVSPCFKNRPDKFWHDQEIIYDFNAQLEGTGSRSALE